MSLLMLTWSLLALVASSSSAASFPHSPFEPPRVAHAATSGADDDEADPLNDACQEFFAAPLEVQQRLVDEMETRVQTLDDPGIQEWLALRDRARRELKVIESESPSYHAPDQYAPGSKRRLLKEDSDQAIDQWNLMLRHGAEPQFVVAIRYDFAKNVGVDTGREMRPDDHLWNYLNGFIRESDLLVAWMQQRLDHDDSLDAIAHHFSRHYATLEGDVNPFVTLYDGFASFVGVDMPDIDVLAYAHEILGDFTHHPPLSPRSTRVLYPAVHDGFLKYFRYRSLVEYFSNLYLNPETPLDYDHETLRERILYAMHLDEGDPQKIRRRFFSVGDRGRFIAEIDRTANEDNSWRWYARNHAGKINARRWKIAAVAYDVLREAGYLRDDGALGTAVTPPAEEEPADAAPDSEPSDPKAATEGDGSSSR